MRIFFYKSNFREDFFNQAFKNNFSSWNEFAKFLNINRKQLLEYRKGRLSLPETLYLKILDLVSKRDRKKFNKSVEKKEDKWGQKKGGERNYSLHKEIYEKGRKKAINSLRNKIPSFDIYQSLSNELSYLTGLFIGDGFCNKYQRYYLTQFTGHLSEKKYYEKIISELFFKICSLKPKILQGKGNFIRINYYSKSLHNLWANRFKFPSGRKSKTVLIPDEILNSSNEIISFCIAGLYDAEGSFYFDKRNKYIHPYPIIEIHLNNPKLILQVTKIFEKFGLEYYLREENRIYFYGKKRVTSFLKRFRLKNPKLLDKIPLDYL